MRAVSAGLFALGVTIAAGSTASAQSAYACRALETHNALPAVEGGDGFFFRIRPDLQAHHGMDDTTAASLGALTKALAARGTTLVILPVPARAQVMSQALPPMARYLGYDADTSSAVYVDMIKRMRAAGVHVADARSAMRTAALAGTPVYFKTDPRPTPQGAQVLAQVVADTLAQVPRVKDLPRATFTTTQGAPFTLQSGMRAQLQLACQTALPEASAPSYTTTGNVIVGATSVTALLGTQISGTPELNLAGFISEATGIRAGAYGVTGGGAFAAISSYLTSADFRQSPPQVIVWEMPVTQSLGQYGDQPLAELVAAAGQTCTQPLALQPGDATNKVLADLSSLQPGKRYTLALDTGGAAVPQVRFHFTSADGQTRSRGIYRHKDQILTGRFFMPLSGFEDMGLRQVMVEIPAAFGPQPSLTACLQGAAP
jgi:alginate biosynthesis protein AlgX